MENKNQTETVTKKSIFKHGAIAMTSIIISLIVIILGIYFYHITHKSVTDETNLEPAKVNTNAENTPSPNS